MNSFQRKSLYAALAGVGALGVTATANAVAINPNGLGQVLIYPYYTVNADAAGNAYNSLLSVVNTTSSAKAVKVRFLEGRNSREVLDFNLFLSKFDVWTAAIIPSSSGGALVKTADKSCTIPESKTTLQLGVNFVNFAYVGDGGGDGLDRTKEGYVEMIEMAAYTSNNCTSIVVTHVGGVPGCQGAKHPLNDNSAQTDASSAFGVSCSGHPASRNACRSSCAATRSRRALRCLWVKPADHSADSASTVVKRSSQKITGRPVVAPSHLPNLRASWAF